MNSTILRAVVIWLFIAALAVVNGVIRESVVAPYVGEVLALSLSGIILSLIVFTVTYFSFSFMGIKEKLGCFLVGAQWVLMTLAFEFVFGHYVAGKSWVEIIQVFNVARGDLFTLVIMVTFFSPFIVGEMKRAL